VSEFTQDVLRGVEEIASYRREPKRRTYHLLENGRLPAIKVGRIWEMRKSTHDRMFAEHEAAALARITASA
jgi:excisionase family DNA binding protein